MTANSPIHRLKLAAMLALTALAMLLAAPSASLARAHKASCHAARATHAKRGSHKCSTAAHKAKPTRAAHHSSHRSRRKPALSHTQSPLLGEEAGNEAKCEDDSTPFASPEGTFSCEDGSEPNCPAGLTATPSSDGSGLLCEALDEEGEAETEES